MVTKESILKSIEEYITTKMTDKKWIAGKDWVQYSGPYFDSNEYVQAAKTLLDGWLVLGQESIKFEKRFSHLLGKKYGVITNSGSSANLLMWAATMKKNKQSSDQYVIVPAAGFPTTVNPIIQLGWKPYWVDIELDTLNIDLNQIEKAARKGVKYITFAHVLGNPPNIDKLMSIVKEYNLTLLEDCCDALGTTYNGNPLGSFGRFASCSFYPAHHLTTMGEGGFVACDTEEDERLLRSLRDWGRGCYCSGKSASLSTKGTCGCRFSKWIPKMPDVIFDHKYVYDNIGYNLKPIELQCSVGLAQLDKLPTIHIKRKENHARLTQIFAPYEEYFHFHKATAKADVSWFAFPLTIKDNTPFKRFDFTSYMESKKIQTRNYFGGNLLLQPAYEHLWSQNDNIIFKIATKVTTDTFFLGTSPVITPDQLDYIQQVTNEFFKNL